MTGMELALRDVGYRYPGAAAPALTGITFAVNPGECVGLLGQNGAGKTTLMRCILGLVPAQGSVAIHGVAQAPWRLQERRAVAALLEGNPLPPELRVHEYLAFRARAKAVPARERKARVADVVARCDLAAKYHAPIGHLSHGYRQRVGLADALLGNPGLILLDEPGLGLDPAQLMGLRALLRALPITVVLSSHQLNEVQAVCERVLVVHAGRLVADERLGEQHWQLEAIWDAPLARVQAALTSWFPLLQQPIWNTKGEHVQLTADVRDPTAITHAIGHASCSHGLPLLRLHAVPPSLHERFVRLTAQPNHLDTAESLLSDEQ